jgi:hypothetical protein
MKIAAFLLLFVVLTANAESRKYYEIGFRPYSEEESFIAVTSDPEIIEMAAKQLALPDEKRDLHINGLLAAGNGGFNRNWNWHIVPGEWFLAEISVEVCDGRPSFVESELEYWLNTVKRYCPWASYVRKEIIMDGTGDEEAEDGIMIFPNPAGDFFMISSDINKGKEGRLRMYNVLGELVLEQEIMGLKAVTGERIYTGGLLPGMYTVMITFDGRTSVKKLVVV